MADEKTSPIPAASSSLDSMFRTGNPIASVEASIPESHRQTLRQMGVAEAPRERARQGVTVAPRAAQQPSGHVLERGDVALDKEKGLKVIVIKAAAGRSKKGRLVHRVVHRKSGEEWLQFDDQLEFLK